ncbi:MAG: type IV pilus secretin family protein [Deltaproteobacteria bacterium]|nr:MAG: type IV pilus secretin family protein [Deltaproteobacteria bacterium]
MRQRTIVGEVVRKTILLLLILGMLVFVGMRVYAEEGTPTSGKSVLKEILVDRTPYFTNVKAKIEGQIANYNSFKVSNPFRIVVDMWGVENLIEKDTLPVDSPQVKEIRLFQQDDKVRMMIETTGDSPLPYMVTEEDGAIVVSVGGGKAEKVTSLERGVKPSEKRPEILGIDLEDFPGKSSVVITYSDKPQMDKAEKDGEITVTFKNVKIASNLLRHLDARSFGIPVTFVDAEKSGNDVVVKIKHQKGAAYSYEEKEGTFVVSFPKAPGREKAYRVAEYRVKEVKEGEKPAAPSEVMKGEEGVREEAVPAFVTVDTTRKKVYRGQRISLDFKDADIHNVLRIIAEVSNLNIITSDEVKGKITLRLINVPWDQALDIILKTKGLGAKLEGNVLRIAPLAKLRAEETEALKSIKSKESLEQLVIETIPVNFADVKELEKQVKEVLSDRGKVKVDSRTNTLIVKDIPKNIKNVRDLVKKLDTPTPQVLIEARIVEVSTQFTRELGVQWGGAYQNTSDGIYVSGIMDDNGTLFAGVQTPDPTFPTYSVNLPAAVGQGSGGGITFGIIKPNFRLDLALSALEVTGNGKVISSPKIVTINNNTASIQQGVKIPYSTVSASGTQTQFVDATLKLEVTPHITPDRTIIMELNATNDTPDFGNAVNGVPSIASREADTQVLVKDGETAVIGGILQIRRTESVDAVPWFYKIPLIGWLFKHETVNNDNTELLIFITPKIVEHGKRI